MFQRNLRYSQQRDRTTYTVRDAMVVYPCNLAILSASTRMRILSFWISQRRGMSSSQLNSVYTKLLERGYLLVFEALQIPTNEGSPRIQQSKMMLSQR